MALPIVIACSRRAFLARIAQTTAGAALVTPLLRGAEPSATRQGRMKICLTPGSIGVTATQLEAIELAHHYGFDAVEPFGGFLASRTEAELSEVVGLLQKKQLVWGAAGLPVDFRQDEEKFRESIQTLPKIAAALERSGAKRVGTWLSPGHNTLTYLENFKVTARRLREAAGILHAHGLRLGLEYVGTQSARLNRKYSFVHSLAETRELIGEIGGPNLGLVLDSWHWWQAGDTKEDLLTLKREEIISVDLNDAPAGLAKAQQLDGRRELPGATGVIEIEGFIDALRRLEYDGPVRAEPFNKALNELDNQAACAATIKAMRQAFAG